MWWLLFLMLPPVAFAGQLDDFLSSNPVVPTTVECGQTYQVYVYRSDGAIDYILVARDGEPVFTFDEYKRLVSAYLYKEHLTQSADNIHLLNPSAVPAFSQLLSKLKDEEYDLSVARNYSDECFPQFVPQIDTMDSVRAKLVNRLQTFISALASEADHLVQYLKAPTARCDFSVNAALYDELDAIVGLLNTYESYSKQIRASIAVTETNCTPDIVQAITSALKPPFTSDQLQYFNTSAATEREIFSYQPDDDEIRALLQNTIKEYWKTLYEDRMNETVNASFGSFTLRDAVQYILATNIPWEREDLVDSIRRKYDEVTRLAADGEYEKAYSAAADLKRLVEDLFKAGVKTKKGLEVPAWAYGIVIIIAGVILWKLLGGRGGNEEESDDYDYSYDYA